MSDENQNEKNQEFPPSTTEERKEWLYKWVKQAPLDVTNQTAIDALVSKFGKGLQNATVLEIARRARQEMSDVYKAVTKESSESVPNSTPVSQPTSNGILDTTAIIAGMRHHNITKIEILPDGTVHMTIFNRGLR